MEEKRISYLQKMIYSIALIAMLFNSNTFWCSSNSALGVFIALIGIITLSIYVRRIDKNIFFMIISITVFLLINMTVTGTLSYIGTNVRLIILITLAILIAKYIDYDFFINFFINSMVLITMVSLVLYLVVSIRGNTSLLSFLPKLTNINGVTAYNALLCCIYTYRYDRLMGIFWEPSIYSSFTIITIIFLIFFRNDVKRKYLKLIILCLGIVASKSTGGYLLLMCTLIFYCMVAIDSVNMKKILLIISFVLIFAVWFNIDAIIASLININPEVFYKLDSTIDSGSRTTRLDSGILNLKIFIDNIITGVGLGHVDSIYASLGAKNQTSTLTFYLAAFGFTGLVPIIVFANSIMKQKYFFWVYRFFLILLFSFILLKEPYMFCCGMYTIIFVLCFNTIRGTRFELFEKALS